MREARRCVLEEVQRLHPRLLDQEWNPGDFNEGKREIIEALDRGVDRTNMEGEEKHNRHIKALAQFIEHGNQRNWWHITLPPYAVDIVLDVPCITPSSMAEQRWIDVVRAASQRFILYSVSTITVVEPYVLAATALLSGVVHAGLCTREKILAFLHADLQALEYDGVHAFLRVTMKEAWFGVRRMGRDGQAASADDGVSFQMFLDPTTVSLIQHLRDQSVLRLVDRLGSGEIESAPVLWKHLSRAIDACGAETGPAKSLKAFFAACTSWATIRNCGLLAHTAASNEVSPSLSPMAWERMRRGQCAEVMNPQRTKWDSAERLSAFKQHQYLRLQPEHAIVQELKELFAGHATSGHAVLLEAMNAFHARHALDQGCIQDLLAGFLRNRLEIPRTRQPPKAISLRRYLDAIGHALVDAFGSRNLLGLSATERWKCYWEVLDDTVSRTERHYVIKRLKEFDQYLVWTKNLEPVRAWQFRYVGPMTLHGEGNLLSQREYDAVLALLSPSAQQQGWRESMISAIGCILSFRCGLRIGEVRRLRVCDIRLHSMPMLVVLANEYGDTKSAFAERRIELGAYLNESELALLNAWHARRIRDAGEMSQEPLLVLRSDDPVPVDDERIRIPVQAAMRAVTGDMKLTLRHLRHSFATWTLFKLTRDLRSNLEDYGMEALKHPEFSAESCRRLRHILSPDTFDPPSGHHPVRNAVYLVASQLGHLSPATSLANYVHLLDVVHITDRNRSLGYPVEDAMTLSRLEKSQIYQRCRVISGVVDGLALMRCLPMAQRKTEKSLRGDSARSTGGSAHDVAGSASEPPIAMSADVVLKLFFVLSEVKRTHDNPTDKDLARYADQYGIAAQELVSCYAACEKFSRHYRTKKTREEPGGLRRHQVIPWVPRTGEEYRELRRYLNKLIDPADRDSEQHRRCGVDHFLSRTMSRKARNAGTKKVVNHDSRGRVRMKDVKEVACYVEFLNGLGVEKKQIRVDLMSLGDDTAEIPSRAECAKLLKLPIDVIHEVPKRDKRHKSHRLPFAVSVESVGFLTGRSRRHHGPIQQQRCASRAFLAALQIAAIIWVMQGENPSQWRRHVTAPHRPELPSDKS